MKKQYVYGLDGIRTLAILGVIFYHLTPYAISGGFLGVNLFFIISGYLLLKKLDRLLSTPVSLGRYVIETIAKRLIKIGKVQLYFLFTTLSAVVVLQAKLLQNIAEMLLSSLFFVNNIWQIISGASYFERHFGQSVFTHLWYLSALMQMTVLFSIVYFFIYMIFKNKYARAIIIGILILCSFGALVVQFNPDNITRVYYGTDTRFFDFLFGVLIAIIDTPIKERIQQSKWRKSHHMIGSILSFIIILVCFALVSDNNSWSYYIGLFGFDIVACYFILVAIDQSSPLFLLFENPIMRMIGKRTFVYYLWYFPVLTIYQSFSKELHWLNVITIVFILILVSELFYQLFDKRDIYKLKRIMPFYKRFIQSIKQQHRYVSWTSIIKYFVLPIFWIVVLIVAPKGQNESAKALQQQITQNAALQQQQEQTNSTQSQMSTTNDKKDTDTKNNESKDSVVTKQVTIIGDSVTLSMYQYLKKHFPNSAIDGKVSRQFYHGVDVVNQMKATNKLYDTVLIMLGANGPFTQANMTALLDAIGSNKQIYFVTIYGTDSWQVRMNDLLNKTAQQNSNIHIVDWGNYSKSHPDWFLSDKVHPNDTGMTYYAKFLAEQLK